jgi:hypothetical protein
LIYNQAIFYIFAKNLEKYHDSEHPVGGCQSAEGKRNPKGLIGSIVPNEFRSGRVVPSQAIPFSTGDERG